MDDDNLAGSTAGPLSSASTELPAAAPPAPVIFDLGSIEMEDVAVLKIKHPQTGNPTGWDISIAGPAHPIVIALQNEIQRENLIEARAQEMARVNNKKWKGEEVDEVRTREKGQRRVAKRIVGWTPVNISGQSFPYSPENAFKLFNDPKLTWASQQVFEYLNDEAAFIASSAKT